MIAMNETVMDALQSEAEDKRETLETVLRQDIHLNSEKIADLNETLFDSHLSPEIRDRDEEAK